MEVEIIFWNDNNQWYWLTTGDPASSGGCSSMAIKLDDTNDEKVWGQISIKESRMGEQNAWRGKNIIHVWYMHLSCGDFIYYPGNFVLVNEKSRLKNRSVCVLHIQEVQIYGRMKSVKCFLKVTESLKYIYCMSPLSAVKQRVVVLTVHI